MSNLQKFNTTLEDFDNEVEKLKAVSNAYQKLQGLSVAYDNINKQFDLNSNALELICDNLKNQQEKMTKSLLDIEYANREINTKLSKLYCLTF